MAEFYFLKSVVDAERQRLRALPGQVLEGEPVDTGKNVQSSRERRSAYPLGTIYGTASLIVKGSFYNSGEIFPILNKYEEYKSPEHRPSEAMVKAYEEFIGTVDSTFRSEFTEKETSKVPTGSMLDKLKKNKKYAVPTIEDAGFYVNPDDWYLLIRNTLNQQNTMLIGPTGSGKTELVKLVCERIGLPLHSYDMGSMHDPISGLLGVHRLKKGGESVFDYAKFSLDIQTRSLVLLDELSRAPVTTNNILFPCLDGRRVLPVEIAGGEDSREIPIHEDCCFFATANIGAEYTGTMSMDRALVNRFFPIELDYLPKDVETKLLMARTGIDKKSADHVVAIANTVRSIYKKQELSASLSTRETLMTAYLIADGWNTLRAMELVFLPLFEGTNSDGERGVVQKTFIKL